MKVFKVQLLVNRVTDDLTQYLQYAYQYNLKHGVELNFDVKMVNVGGYQSAYTQVRPNVWEYVLTGAEKVVPIDTAHDITIFLFDLNEWKTPWWNPFPLLPNTPTSDTILVNNKPFINLSYYAKDPQGTKTYFVHELMHAYRMMADVAGIPVIDQMDTYDQNSNPDSLTGNFAIQWKLLAPFLNPTMTTQPTSVPSAPSKLDLWCKGAIQMENADKSLNNPGNIRYVPGTWMQKLATGEKNGFCVFKDYQTGYGVLKEFFTNAATGKSSIYHPTDNLYQFYSKYAPDSDGNDSKHYAEFVASIIGVSPTVQIKSLV